MRQNGRVQYRPIHDQACQPSGRGRKPKYRTFALLFVLVGTAFAAQDASHDFRKADWGMTRDQVLATEAGQPADVQLTGEQTVVSFDSVGGGELPGKLIYIFVRNRLVRAKYISSAQHEELNDFISDFAATEHMLAEKYGKALADRAIWENDLYQQERLPYLEQDRAHASDILPSDRNTGLSVAMGHLKMYTERLNARTRVVHALTGGDSRIIHQIEYRSLELENSGDTAARLP
jgi:hypothetical protein